MIALAAILAVLRRSHEGRVLAAVRLDESAAGTLGIDVVRYKLLAFVLGAMMAAGVGVLSTPIIRVIDPRNYVFSRAVDILAYAVLGGVAHWSGPIVGATVLTLLPGGAALLAGAARRRQRPDHHGLDHLPAARPGRSALLGRPAPSGSGRATQARARRSTPLPRTGTAASTRARRCWSSSGLTRRFGGLAALEDVSFDVPTRQHLRADRAERGRQDHADQRRQRAGAADAAGGCWSASVDVTGRPSHVVAALGVARTFQNIRLFNDLSVLENVMVGWHLQRRATLVESLLGLPRARREEQRAREVARGLIARLRPGAPGRAPRPARCRTAISGGSRSRGRWRSARSCCCWTSRRPA